jgi:regulator of cell morphogenesis and NO signaling
MEHIVSRKKEIQPAVVAHGQFTSPLHQKQRIPDREMIQPDAALLESMIENEVKSFHQKSGNEVMIIYDLSQEVYYRHNNKNPELAKLAASLFLFFSDLGYYLKIENQRLIPLVQNLIKNVKLSETGDYAVCRLINELKHEIQREHYSVIDKLKYFRILTGDYRIPGDACKSYKLLFEKLKKIENDLVLYIHFENESFFPLAIDMEKYFKKSGYEKK